MKRLKKYWDEIHPELNFLSNKKNRDQASRIEKNKVVMATEYETVTTNIVENVTLNKDHCFGNNNITNNKDFHRSVFFIIKSITRSTVRDFTTYASA